MISLDIGQVNQIIHDERKTNTNTHQSGKIVLVLNCKIETQTIPEKKCNHKVSLLKETLLELILKLSEFFLGSLR